MVHRHAPIQLESSPLVVGGASKLSKKDLRWLCQAHGIRNKNGLEEVSISGDIYIFYIYYTSPIHMDTMTNLLTPAAREVKYTIY